MPSGIYQIACSANGKVYVIGGDTAFSWGSKAGMGGGTGRDAAPSSVMSWASMTEEYNPIANTWATKAPKPTAAAYAGAAAIDNKIYVPGGRGKTQLLSVVEVYDATANTWGAVASMPWAQWGHAVAAVGGKLIFGLIKIHQ